MNFYITTLGCKVNQYESEFMRELLIENEFEEAGDSSLANINIINTCTVTAVADSKNRKVVNRIRRENPASIIVLTGCMPQTVSYDDDPIYDKCDIILGNDSRRNIVNIIKQYLKDLIRVVDVTQHNNSESFEEITISKFEDRTRAFLKIEDGCNQFCTYCTIPYARGRVRSKSINTIKEEVQNLAKNGFSEIVLVGINLSCYGQDIDTDITEAVKVTCEVEGIKRVRLGSYEPERLTESMISMLAKEKKFCPQFHLSLQSGCSKTLERMHRHYNADDFYQIVLNIRKYFDNPSITTDLMVGFAGENEKEFNESYEFVKKVGFAKVHIFPYSRRKGTKAYAYDNQVDDQVKKLRCKKMEELSDILRNNFLMSQIGLIESVLIETKKSNGKYIGYTKNYLPVQVESEIDLLGKIIDVKIIDVESDYCLGVYEDEAN